jgi:FkbM family methyltransferase
MKPPTALSVDNPHTDPPDSAREAIDRLEQELKAALDSHRRFGAPSPDASGLRRLMQRVIRRSLTWYTRPNQLFQGAVIRALQDIRLVLEHERVDREWQAVLSGRRLAPWEIDFSETATQSDILSCFRLLLGRNPEKHEWPGHAIRAGERLDVIVRSYLNCKEFIERHLLEHRGANAQLVELPNFKIYASPGDTFIGRVIIRSGEYEPHVAQIFHQSLRPGMVVLDIGANIGYFSLLAASLVGQDGFVYSWEPSPANARMLYASQLANRFTNIKIVQAAATETSGLLGYFPSSSNGNVAELAEASSDDVLSADTVMGLRIDDVLPKDARVAFVKIDVEGFEFRAMAGAREMLDRCRPSVVSEFSPEGLRHSSGVSGREYLEFFASRHYEFWLVTNSGQVAASIEEVLSRCERSGADHIDILLRPGRSSGT